MIYFVSSLVYIFLLFIAIYLFIASAVIYCIFIGTYRDGGILVMPILKVCIINQLIVSNSVILVFNAFLLHCSSYQAAITNTIYTV